LHANFIFSHLLLCYGDRRRRAIAYSNAVAVAYSFRRYAHSFAHAAAYAEADAMVPSYTQAEAVSFTQSHAGERDANAREWEPNAYAVAHAESFAPGSAPVCRRAAAGGDSIRFAGSRSHAIATA